MEKRFFERAAGLASVILSLSAFTSSCDSGLGAAVDTQAPTLTIETPVSREIKTGDILLSGTWNDDKNVTKVSVTVNDGSNVIYSQLEAAVGNKTWQLPFATNTSEDKENGYFLADGKYDVVVNAFDKAGHDSGGVNRTFEVDTTPPLFFTTKPNKFQSGVSASSYGRSVKILGAISDDHDVQKMTVTVYDAETGEKINLHKSEFTGADFKKADTTVNLAEYYLPEDRASLEEGSPEWYALQNYLDIYGDSDNPAVWGNLRKYFVRIDIEDKPGNSTNRIYSKDAVNSEIKSVLKIKEAPEQSELKDIINGSYSKSELTESQVEKIAEILSADYENAASYVTSDSNLFYISISSAVNPKFLVNNLDYNAGNTDSFKSVSIESMLELKLEMGGDQKEIDPSTVKVFITRLKSDLSEDENSVIEVPDSLIVRASSESGSEPVTLEKEKQDKEADPTKNIGDGFYSISIPSLNAAIAENPSIGKTIKAGSRYKVTVIGNDESLNEIVGYADKNYGFAVEDTGSPNLEVKGYISSAAPNEIKAGEDSVFANGSTEFTVYGEYSNDKTGLSPLMFSLGNENYVITDVKYSHIALASDTDDLKDQLKSVTMWKDFSDFYEQTTTIRSFKATFVPDRTGDLEVSGYNEVYNSASTSGKSNAKVFSITLDDDYPSLESCALSSSYSASDDSYYAKFFINNKKGTFTFSGVANDEKEVESVTLNYAGKTYICSDSPRTWKFENLNLSNLEDQTIFNVIVTDAAGNTASENILVKFDTEGPSGVHYAAANNKDIVFRIGNTNNDTQDLQSARQLDGSALTKPLTWNKNLDEDVGGKYAAGTYGDSETVIIRGYFLDEGSGLSEIYYKLYTERPDAASIEAFAADYENLKDGSFHPLSESQVRRVFYKEQGSTGNSYVTCRNVETNFRTSITNFKEGNNYLVLVAVDNVGNAKADTMEIRYDNTTHGNGWNGGTAGSDDGILGYSLNVDLKVPDIDSNEKFSSETTYTNTKQAVTIYGTATDKLPSAGIKNITLEVNGKTISSDDGPSQYGQVSFAQDDQNAPAGACLYNWTATIEPKVFSGMAADAVVEINATVTDDAGTGHSQTVVVARVSVDTTPPTVVLDEPQDAYEEASDVNKIQVNGNLKLTGTAKDSCALEDEGEVKLYYTTNATVGKVSSIQPDKFATAVSADRGWVEYTGSTGTTESVWSISGIDTKQLSSVDGKTVYLTVSVKDSAENAGYAAPVAVEVDQNSDRPIIQITNIDSLAGMTEQDAVWLKNTNLVYFTTKDDDGIVSKVEYSTDGGANFTEVADMKSGAGSFELSDGLHTVLFRVKDSEGNTFTTGDASSLKAPRIKGGADAGDRDVPLYLSVDKTSPVSRNVSFSYYDRNLSAYTDYTDEVSMVGGAREKLKLQLEAGDENDIAGVSVTLAGSAYDAECTVDSAFDSATQKYFSTWTLTDVDVSELESDYYVLTIKITDKAGLSKTDTVSLSVDNSEPVVTITSPSVSEIASGKVIAYGNLSGAVSVEYAVSPSKTVKPNGVTKIANWNGPEKSGTCSSSRVAPSYTALKKMGSIWRIYFDNDTDNETADHAVSLNRYLVNFGITTDAALNATGSSQFADYVYLYLWIKATDEVGNVFEKPFEIYLDPQGDRPELSISSPSDGSTVSGSVNVYGTASDTKGLSIGVDSVWVQMISEDHGENPSTGYGSYTTSDTASGFKTYNVKKADLDYMNSKDYFVYNMKKFVAGGNNAGFKWKGSLGTGESYSDYAAYVEPKGKSWSITINGTGEFNPVSTGDGKNPVGIRVYARDKDGKFSLNDDRLITFDADTPKISGLQLRQYTTEGSVKKLTASRQYQPDMYIKGAWYVQGSVTDKDTISSLKIIYGTDAKGNELSDTLVSSGTVESAWVSAVESLSSGDGFVFEYPLKNPDGTLLTSESDVGAVNLTIHAEDGANPFHHHDETVTVFYDNKAPEIAAKTSGDFNISSEIMQSDSWYVFGSSVKEEPKNNTAQAGFAYTAFYFERENTVNNTTKIYDILKPRNQAAIDITARLANNSIKELGSETSYADNTIVKDSGLYWYRKNVSRDTNLNILKMSEMTGIRENALVKIGGAFYRISGVEGNDVTIDGYPVAEFNTAYVAIAGIIDNTGEDSPEDGVIETDGYYESPENDDGDRMIENVENSGTNWTWEARVCSRNITDGPVKLHYVVFDNAGNYRADVVEGIISNNRPRLAGFILKTDYDNDNAVDEVINSYSAAEISEDSVTGSVTVSGASRNVYNPDADSKNLKRKVPLNTSIEKGTSSEPIAEIRGYTVIVPEIVGGNGSIYYDYKAAGTHVLSGQNSTPIISSGTTDYTVAQSADINIQLGDLLAVGDGASVPFTFNFWDSTEATTRFVDSQKATLKVYLGIAAASVSTPVVKIKPFYWKGITENSVYDSSTAKSYTDLKGHIELEADWKKTKTYTENAAKPAANQDSLFDGDPKVSGQIVIEGTSHDDSLIKTMNVLINGTSYSAASYSTAEGTVVSSRLKAAYDTNGFWFEITKNTLGESGHDVEWKLNLNTEKFGVRKNSTVEVTATNYGVPVVASGTSLAGLSGTKTYASGISSYTGGKTNARVTTQTGAVQTAYYRMDVVPYITGIKTSLSKYDTASKPNVYNRTALGHYPVYAYFEGKQTAAGTANAEVTYETVKVTGFNLQGSSIKFEKDTSSNEIELEATDENLTYKLKIPETASSGNISAVNGTITSLNNLNNDDSRGSFGYEIDEDGNVTDLTGSFTHKESYDVYSNYYNRMPNGENNNSLTDNVYIDIWDFNTQAAVAYNNGKVDNLEMKINPSNGLIGFAFSNGALRFDMASRNNSYEFWNMSYDYMSHNALAYDSEGNSYGLSVGGDINSGGASDIFSLMSSRWGAETKPGQGTNYGGSTHTYLDRIGQHKDETSTGNNNLVQNKDRFQSQSFASHVTSGNGTNAVTNLYMAYFDKINSEIRFKAGKFTSETKAKEDFGTFKHRPGNTEGANLPYSDSHCQVVANGDESETLGFAGQYLSLGVLVTSGNDVAVLTWYDGSDLKFAWNSSPLSGKTGKVVKNSAGWSPAETLISGGGEHCQLAVDNENGIHIAAYDSTNANLNYVYIPYDEENMIPDMSGKKTCIVDSYLDAGEYLTIDVAKKGTYQIPYIGYWAAYPEKPRYAYLYAADDFYNGTVENGADEDFYTGLWECTIVPTQSSVKDGRKMNTAVWKLNGNLAYSTVGDEMGNEDGENMYKSSYSTDTEGVCYGNGSENGVMAYVVAPKSAKFCAETAQMR